MECWCYAAGAARRLLAGSRGFSSRSLRVPGQILHVKALAEGIDIGAEPHRFDKAYVDGTTEAIVGGAKPDLEKVVVEYIECLEKLNPLHERGESAMLSG